MAVRKPSGLNALLRDSSGAALLEFAIVMPVMLMMIFGTLEFGLNVYTRSVLEGAMQQAGRNSTLQSSQSSQSSIDAYVSNQIHNILPNATVTFTRENYPTFSQVGRPEDFTDTNGNGVRDAGECFQDLNGNGTSDADSGRSGVGGANDVVLYTATVSYTSFIPVGAALKISPTTTMKAATILRNQPFATEPSWNAVQVCT
jgi:Flp pilus assembly protein TadG